MAYHIYIHIYMTQCLVLPPPPEMAMVPICISRLWSCVYTYVVCVCANAYSMYMCICIRLCIPHSPWMWWGVLGGGGEGLTHVVGGWATNPQKRRLWVFDAFLWVGEATWSKTQFCWLKPGFRRNWLKTQNELLIARLAFLRDLVDVVQFPPDGRAGSHRWRPTRRFRIASLHQKAPATWTASDEGGIWKGTDGWFEWRIPIRWYLNEWLMGWY